MIALTVPSPIGPLTVGAHGGRLIAVRFEDAGDRAQEEELRAAARQLEQYFSGRRRRFELPLDLRAGPFDRRVLAAVAEIRFGERISYGELAARFGLTGEDVRKVAAAVGRNPLPILIPCHRVVGADGALVGYGGGIQRKAQLLALEAGQLQMAV
ncbi:MAG TPA: methylated-DNA--[protein]-cysteine S-methyltransferase [Thermoleophilaceae bacterium]|jgi:methylated-DNA-[protein]-cysteine S-methyltransferase